MLPSQPAPQEHPLIKLSHSLQTQKYTGDPALWKGFLLQFYLYYTEQEGISEKLKTYSL